MVEGNIPSARCQQWLRMQTALCIVVVFKPKVNMQDQVAQHMKAASDPGMHTDGFSSR